MTTRRSFMKILGGGILVAAGGGAIWAATRDPQQARLAWQKAGQSHKDPRIEALSYALLAPNPHNRQPWIADLATAGQIALYCEGGRRLPATDPFDRQTTIGLGAFIELLVMGAAHNGYRADVALFPEGEPQPRLDDRPVARVTLIRQENIDPDPLFTHVLERRTNRTAFDMTRPIAEAVLRQLSAVATPGSVVSTNHADLVAELRELGWKAMVTEMTTPATALENINLTRIGKAAIEANPDGISLAGPMVEALALAGMLSTKDMLDIDSTTFKQMTASLKTPFDTAMGFVWLTTPANTRVDQIAAGRDYVRINLAATRAHLSMHPLSQALQEFAEMKPHYQAIRKTLQIPQTATLQMFARIGYGEAINGSPRWPLASRIRGA